MTATGDWMHKTAPRLSCKWGFNETGRRLAAQGSPDHELYAEWVDTYSAEEFTELTEWCLDLMDDVAGDAPERDRERYRALFRTSTRYEYRFWDAAWRQEEWTL